MSSVWIVPPFTDKINRIESITLSEEQTLTFSDIKLQRQFLYTIVRTTTTPYEPAVFHLVIFDLSQQSYEHQSLGKCCTHYVIPHAMQVWNDPKNTEDGVGKVVKVLECVQAEDKSSVFIWTLINNQSLEGGIYLIVWNFDIINYQLRIIDQRQLDNTRGSYCIYFEKL